MRVVLSDFFSVNVALIVQEMTNLSPKIHLDLRKYENKEIIFLKAYFARVI